MKKFLPILALLLSVSLAWTADVPTPSPTKAAPAVKTPAPKKPRKFIKPENPVIRVSTVVINRVRMWQVEVVTGSLELQNFTRLKQGASMTLTESDIVWKIGQIVEIGGNDVWAGGKNWMAGTRLFVDERGRFLPITGRAPAGKPPK